MYDPSAPSSPSPSRKEEDLGAKPGWDAAPPPVQTPDQQDPKAYWRANILFVTVLLLVWFTVSCVLSIFLVNSLNEIHIGGFPLGFWFSQQGAILTFILLIFVYAVGMTMIDRKFGVEEGVMSSPAPATGAQPPAVGGGSPAGGASEDTRA